MILLGEAQTFAKRAVIQVVQAYAPSFDLEKVDSLCIDLVDEHLLSFCKEHLGFQVVRLAYHLFYVFQSFS